MISLEKPFPSFALPDQNGVERTLREFSGRWLVVYFYPKDNTGGCSTEAAEFAASHRAFVSAGAAVLGVSADSVKSHGNFVAKLSLPFPLLSDPEHILLEACGVWQKKKMAGREYMGVVRTTALVDPKGTVQKLWLKVKPAGHAYEVLQTFLELQDVSGEKRR